MATVNNTIDKFGRGRRSNKSVIVRGPPGIGFKLTTDNHYDIQGKRLKNTGEPVDDLDGATRKYVDDQIDKCIKDTLKAIQKVADLITDRVRTYVAEKIKNLNGDYQKNLDKSVNDLKEQMRTYVDVQLEEVKSLNVLSMRQNNTLVERVRKLEQTVTDSQSKKTSESGTLALPPIWTTSPIES